MLLDRDADKHYPPLASGVFDLPAKAPDMPTRQRPKLGPPGFEAWWAAWPNNGECCGRKRGRPKCLRAWNARGYEAVAEAILARLEADKKLPQWNKSKGQFIPMPYTWLNDEPWEQSVVRQYGSIEEVVRAVWPGAPRDIVDWAKDIQARTGRSLDEIARAVAQQRKKGK
jgi:hypothetical protein